jgi:hypothetical protein
MYFITENFSSLAVVLTRVAIIIVLTAVLLVVSHLFQKQIFPIVMSAAIVVVSLLALTVMIELRDFPFDLITIEMNYFILLLNHATGVFLRYSVIACVMISIPWAIVTALFASDGFVAIGNGMFILVFIIINLYTTYTKERHQRQLSNLKRLGEKNIENNNSLLN